MAPARNTLPVYPEIIAKRPPDPIRCAIEIYGLPDDWEIASAEINGDLGSSTEYAVYEGAVYPRTLFGERDYKNPQAGTERTLALPSIIYRQWLAKWEAETGHCYKCGGSGSETAGWKAPGGRRFRPCSRCDATGSAPKGERAAA